MALNHSVVDQRYQMREQKEAKKAPFDWLRLSVILAGIAVLVGIILFPQNMAILFLSGIIILFIVTMMYARAVQNRQLTR